MFHRRSFYRNRKPSYNSSVSYPTTKVEDKDGSLNLASRLSTLLADPALTQSNKDFVSSLNNFFSSKNYLTTKQYEYFQKIESQYSSTAKQEKASWLSSFDAKKKENFKICIEYYRVEGHGYYSNIQEKVKNDSNYIPTYEEYSKVCENKYSERILNGYRSKPKYEIDQTVTISDNWLEKNLSIHRHLAFLTDSKIPPTTLTNYSMINNQYTTIKLEKPTYIIWGYDKYSPISACKGNKIYTLFSVSTGNPERSIVYCEERFLKKVK